jgi:hypothetical protein
MRNKSSISGARVGYSSLLVSLFLFLLVFFVLFNSKIQYNNEFGKKVLDSVARTFNKSVGNVFISPVEIEAKTQLLNDAKKFYIEELQKITESSSMNSTKLELNDNLGSISVDMMQMFDDKEALLRDEQILFLTNIINVMNSTFNGFSVKINLIVPMPSQDQANKDSDLYLNRITGIVSYLFDHSKHPSKIKASFRAHPIPQLVFNFEIG